MLPEFSTSDLYPAGYILSKGIKLLKIDKIPGSSKCIFVFENLLACKTALEEYWNNQGEITPKTYAEAIKSLKDRLFAGI